MFVSSRVKLVIFDVDGTLVTTKSGATFRKTADDWQWLPGRLEGLQELDRRGVKLAIATNQGGVAFGYFSHAAIVSELYKLADEAHIPLVMWCETHPKASIDEYRVESPRRKPGPGMLNEIIEQGRLLHMGRCVLFIGSRTCRIAVPFVKIGYNLVAICVSGGDSATGLTSSNGYVNLRHRPILVYDP